MVRVEERARPRGHHLSQRDGDAGAVVAAVVHDAADAYGHHQGRELAEVDNRKRQRAAALSRGGPPPWFGSCYATGRTFDAWGPFGPSVTSNSTFWFSSRLRYPAPEIALKCTNTSGPSSWVMKPNPFSGLNHFTVPVVIAASLLPWPSRTWLLSDEASGRFAGEGTARSHSVWRNKPKTACGALYTRVYRPGGPATARAVTIRRPPRGARARLASLRTGGPGRRPSPGSPGSRRGP